MSDASKTLKLHQSQAKETPNNAAKVTDHKKPQLHILDEYAYFARP